MKTALLLIDIQNDYFPGGKMELEGPVEAAQKANELLQCFRDHAMPTVHIQHVSLNPDATFFIPGDRGTDINDINTVFLDRIAAAKPGVSMIVAAQSGELAQEGLEILAGLDEGEEVVTAGVRRLSDGQRVKRLQESGAQ